MLRDSVKVPRTKVRKLNDQLVLIGFTYPHEELCIIKRIFNGPRPRFIIIITILSLLLLFLKKKFNFYSYFIQFLASRMVKYMKQIYKALYLFPSNRLIAHLIN